MNKNHNGHEDPLKKYINKGMTEEAPEGFTSRVMSLVMVDVAPVKRHGILDMVPLISIIVTGVLIGLVFLLPDSNTDAFAFTVPELMKNVKLSLPDFGFSDLFSINFPSTILYIAIGIMILSLFDKALREVFHREN
jgi:hypothetical protein